MFTPVEWFHPASRVRAVCDAVVIQLKVPTATTKFLNLAEVQLWDGNGNLVPREALTFTLSSTYSTTYSASRCNDGAVSGVYCSTANANNPPPVLTIKRMCMDGVPVARSVSVWNRFDNIVYAKRITDFTMTYFAGPTAWSSAAPTLTFNFSDIASDGQSKYSIVVSPPFPQGEWADDGPQRDSNLHRSLLNIMCMFFCFFACDPCCSALLSVSSLHTCSPLWSGSTPPAVRAQCVTLW